MMDGEIGRHGEGEREDREIGRDAMYRDQLTLTLDADTFSIVKEGGL
jgi:hypothetical protein